MNSTDATEKAVVAAVPKGLLIAGSWQEAASGRLLGVEDPSTGETIATVADAGPDDGLRAVEAAVAAQNEWGASAPRERSEILRRAFEEIIRRRGDLARLMTLEMGKPLAESDAEVAYAAEFLRWFSEEAVRIRGQYSSAPDGRSRVLTMRQPVGPCLLITPWNFPMAMAARKIGPAVAAGCTMVLKPAKQTPLSALALAQILTDAGLPQGVLDVVTTSSPGDLVQPMLADGRIRKLSFTGSTEVGRLLVEQSGRQLVRVSMELGGNAAFIVFGDADVDAAVRGAVIAKMRNIGEACTAANRVLVERSVEAKFSAKLGDAMGSMRMGRGTDEGVEVGPLIDAASRDRVARLVSDAVRAGATIVTGGAVPAGPGYFYPPTVVRDVPSGARLLHEEIFGPVAPVRVFSSEEEVISAANETEHGLVAYLYTSNLGRALRMTEGLEVGMVGLNQGMVSNPAAPFGGVKHSGFGREGGSEGMDEYLQTKYVAISADT